MPLVHLDAAGTGWTGWAQWFGEMGYRGDIRRGDVRPQAVAALLPHHLKIDDLKQPASIL